MFTDKIDCFEAGFVVSAVYIRKKTADISGLCTHLGKFTYRTDWVGSGRLWLRTSRGAPGRHSRTAAEVGDAMYIRTPLLLAR